MSDIIYLIGSLRNPQVPEIGKALRAEGFEVFDDWFAAGPIADDSWRDYEMARGRTYAEALEGHAAFHVFDFDYHHLNRATTGVLVLPAGKSGHIEFGYLCGQGKPTFILMDQPPERWDVMYRFATKVVYTQEELIDAIHKTDGQGFTEGPFGRPSAFSERAGLQARMGELYYK